MNLRLILYSFLVMSAAACGAQDFYSGGFAFSLTSRGGEAMVVENIVGGLNAYEGVCIIPPVVYYDGNNYSVTGIAPGAFAASRVFEVVIPNTVTRIGEEAFLDCDRLTDVTLPLHISHIPRECFLGTSIESIAIPEGVTRVGYGAFQDCHLLHTVFLPSSLKHIEPYAFASCHNLYEIYCAATKPPRATGWGVWDGVGSVDLIVPDEEAMDAYLNSKGWSHDGTFAIYPNEDIAVRPASSAQPFNQDWKRVELGQYLAYKVIDESGQLVALTASRYCYLPASDHDVAYTIVPTTMMGDGLPEPDIVEHTTGLQPLVDDAFPAEPEPIIVAHGGTIYVYANNYRRWLSVWDMSGRLYYNRISSDAQVIDLPRNRVYIVKIGDYVKKIFI